MAQRNYIKIDRSTTTATHAQMLITYVNALRDAMERGREVLDIMDHNWIDTTFTDLEALFGIPVGQGQTVYNLVNNGVQAMLGDLKSNDCKQLIERVG